MANLLTINSHSWMEEGAQEKLAILGQAILDGDYDIICIQEVNQLLHSEPASQLLHYCPIAGAPLIHEDNYALRLVQLLSEQGQTYYWSWAYNHIGYDRFQEGVAILSKEPLVSEGVLVSQVDDENDFHTRRALLAKTKLGQTPVVAVSLHLSWWGKGFKEEWDKLEQALLSQQAPLIVMGDFNNPVGNEGYQTIMKSPLGLKDSHQVAQSIYGQATIKQEIDGWQGNQEALKVDHIFLSSHWQVASSEVIFDGEHYPLISDHCGLACQAKLSSFSG